MTAWPGRGVIAALAALVLALAGSGGDRGRGLAARRRGPGLLVAAAHRLRRAADPQPGSRHARLPHRRGLVPGTRVLDSRRRHGVWEGTLATTDPGGRRLAVRLEPDARGVVALQVKVTGPGAALAQATGISFVARARERYLGFGERSNRVDQRGGEVENYVAEGPYEEDERAMIPLFVPAWGFHPRPDATYYPVPWLLSSAGYGVLVDDPETSYFRLDQGASGTWSVEVQAPRLSLRVFAGPRPADVLRRFTARTGRQPPVVGAVFPRPLVPAHRQRRGRGARAADPARRAAVGGPDLHALSPVRGAGGQGGGRARARCRLPPGGARGDHLLQPDDLHHPSELRRGGGHRRARPRTRRAGRTCTATAP